jgi:formylmethanofuran dehydrogenase subunit C
MHKGNIVMYGTVKELLGLYADEGSVVKVSYNFKKVRELIPFDEDDTYLTNHA